nr:hypothetical protein [Algoriphagus locisalis]
MLFSRLGRTLLFILLSIVALAEQPFFTSWQTNTDTASITMPVNSPLTGFYYLSGWVDGSMEANLTGDISFTYTNAGVNTVALTDSFPVIQFSSESSGRVKDQKLLSIEEGSFRSGFVQGIVSPKSKVLNPIRLPSDLLNFIS